MKCLSLDRIKPNYLFKICFNDGIKLNVNQNVNYKNYYNNIDIICDKSKVVVELSL